MARHARYTGRLSDGSDFLSPSVYLFVIVLVTRVSALMSSVGAEYPTEQQVEAMVAKVKECTRGCFRVGKLKE